MLKNDFSISFADISSHYCIQMGSFINFISKQFLYALFKDKLHI